MVSKKLTQEQKATGRTFARTSWSDLQKNQTYCQMSNMEFPVKASFDAPDLQKGKKTQIRKSKLKAIPILMGT